MDPQPVPLDHGRGRGVAVLGVDGLGIVDRKACTLCRTRPVARSRHTARIEWPSLSAVVSQMRFSRITGDDQPRPGIGIFQVTFSASLQVVASPTASVCPCPFGPRNCGHDSPANATCAAQRHTENQTESRHEKAPPEKTLGRQQRRACVRTPQDTLAPPAVPTVTVRLRR